MKNIHSAFNALFGIAGLSALLAAAPAAAIPLVDTVDPTPDIGLTVGLTPFPCPAPFTCGVSTVSFVHDITTFLGFVPGLDILTSAEIAINLLDPNGGSEGFAIDLGIVQNLTFSPGNVGGGGRTELIGLNAGALTDLGSDGKITVKITAIQQGGGGASDFNFNSSILTAQVTKVTVPEPSTLLMLGGGLAGLGWRLRRRR